MSRLRWMYVGIGITVVLALAATTAVFLLSGKETPTASVSPSPSPSSTSPSLVEVPRAAQAVGDISGWQFAPTTAVAYVGPQVGAAAEGSVALVVDAPNGEFPAKAASVAVPVTPGEKYSITARVRVMSADATAVPAVLKAGDTEIAFGTLDAAWTLITGTMIATGATLDLALLIDGPTVGVGLDDVHVSAADGVNVVPNPSFEDVVVSSRIANDSLVLRTDTAAIAVGAMSGKSQWAVLRGEDVIARGDAESSGPLAAVSLVGVPQGYYTFTLTDAEGVETSTPIAVLDGGVDTGDARFGVGIHVEDEWYSRAARYTRSLGIAEARNDILWQLNEKEPGVYDFDPRYTNGFDQLHVNGVKVLGIANYGNALYGGELAPDNPDAIAAYGRYAAAIVKRFDLVGLEVFNEFNQARFNDTPCGTAPSCYLPLLKAVHDNVRPVDPDLPLVAGSTANYDEAWLNGLWQAGGLEYADAMSFHPYQVVPSPFDIESVIASARAGMRTYGGGEKPIWISEIGSPSTPASGTVADQARFLVRVAGASLGAGAQRFVWYDLINDSTDPSDHEGNFGLFYRSTDGVAAYPPKPAAFAYGLLIDQLRGKAAVTASSPLDPAVRSFDFGTGSSRLTLAWGLHGDVQVRVPASTAITVVAMDGSKTVIDPVQGVATVTVPESGVYIDHSAGR